MKGRIVRFSDNTYGIEFKKFLFPNKYLDFEEPRVHTWKLDSKWFQRCCRRSLEIAIRHHKILNPNPIKVNVLNPNKETEREKYYKKIIEDWELLQE